MKVSIRVAALILVSPAAAGTKSLHPCLSPAAGTKSLHPCLSPAAAATKSLHPCLSPAAAGTKSLHPCLSPAAPGTKSLHPCLTNQIINKSNSQIIIFIFWSVPPGRIHTFMFLG